jgi:hypothetical protein
MPESEYSKMMDSFNRLDYMVKTTAPHLQRFMDELQAGIQAAVKEAATSAAPVPVVPPPPNVPAPLAVAP